MAVFAWIVLTVVDIPLVIGIGWCFFGDWRGFLVSLLTSLKTLLLGSRLFDDEQEDFWQPLKLLAFVVTCAALIYVEFLLLSWLKWV